MKKFIIVEVSLCTPNPKEPYKKVFSRLVEVNNDLVLPYEMIVNALSFIFGSKSVVSVSLYNSIG